MKSKNNAVKEKSSAKRILLSIVIFIICLLFFGIIAGCILFGMEYSKASKELTNYDNFKIDKEAVEELDDSVDVINSGSRISYDGKMYKLNENVVSIAFIGVDKESFGLKNGAVGTGGQADTIALCVYDTQSGKVNIVYVPRDSMVDVNTYDVNGNFAGIDKEQICVSFAYGDGHEKSCERVISALSRLLFGMKVDYYISMDTDGIGNLNDAIGGITLESLETFGVFQKGKTYKLKGIEAERYVRYRNKAILDGDKFRQLRQRQFFEAYYKKALQNAKSDISSVTTLYNEAKKFIVTNFGLDKTVYLASQAVKNTPSIENYITVPGKYIDGGKYAEYIVDYNSLFKIILDVFYSEV